MDHHFAHLGLGELAVVEGTLELHVEQLGPPESGQHADGEEAALAQVELRPAPDVAEEMVDGVGDEVALDGVGVDLEVVDLLHPPPAGLAVGPRGPVLGGHGRSRSLAPPIGAAGAAVVVAIAIP
jgi:hypothetical protein